MKVLPEAVELTLKYLECILKNHAPVRQLYVVHGSGALKSEVHANNFRLDDAVVHLIRQLVIDKDFRFSLLRFNPHLDKVSKVDAERGQVLLFPRRIELGKQQIDVGYAAFDAKWN